METVRTTEHGMTVKTDIVLDAESGVLSEHVTLSTKLRRGFPRRIEMESKTLLKDIVIGYVGERHDLPA